MTFVAKRIEGCACGGLIAADPTSERALSIAVRKHQRTWRHLAWRDKWVMAAPTFVVARLVETPEGWFLEPVSGSSED